MVSQQLQLLPSMPAWVWRLPTPILLVLAPFAVALTVVALLITYFLTTTLYRHFALYIGTDIYAAYPRPKHTSKRWGWIFGDLPEIRKAAPAEAHIKWERDLNSKVYVYRGPLYQPRLVITDTSAMNYVLGQAHSYMYPKPNSARLFLLDMLGNGLLVAEGDVHKRQRKIIQPAFNVSAMRDLTPLFFRHANAFVAKLGRMIDETKGPAEQPFIEGQSVHCSRKSEKGKLALDISHWYGRLTLDIIGDAGFGHTFDAVRLPIKEQTDSIVESFRTMMSTFSNVTIIDIFFLTLSRIRSFEWANRVPTKRRRVVDNARASLDATGKTIIERKRQEIKQEMLQGISTTSPSDEKAFFDEKSRSKDLLYLMMKANMATAVRESERMSDDELLGQITTLLTAGHETTSTLLTWFTYVMMQEKNAHVVQKLRAEIDEHFAGRDELDYDALMAMPYLDNCTKEVLRFHSPVTMTEREASQDDMIPLGRAVTMRDGKSTRDSVPIKKGQVLFILVQALNRSKDFWGPTADEFDPDRWTDVPRAAKESGFPLQILSFLEGPRGCIGSRFALAEFKAILCTLVRSLNFESLGWDIEPKQGIVVRPRVIGQEDLGIQLPACISRI